MKRLLPLILLVPGTARASAQAKSAADWPTLEMPPVPPRVIEPVLLEPAPPEPVAELPAAAPAPAPPPRTRNTPPRARRPSPSRNPSPRSSRTGGRPAARSCSAAAGTPGTPEGPEAARQVRTVIDRASKTLKSIDSRRLPPAEPSRGPQREPDDQAVRGCAEGRQSRHRVEPRGEGRTDCQRIAETVETVSENTAQTSLADQAQPLK